MMPILSLFKCCPCFSLARQDYLRSCGWSYLYHILKHIWVPGFLEVVSKDSIGLIVGGLAFEAIKCPICPVDICFFEVAHEIFPGDISLVVAELSQEIGITQSTN